MDIERFILYSTGFVLLLVLTQDFHVFPGAFLSKAKFWTRRTGRVPPEVESTFIKSKDGTLIETWRYGHGNASPFSNYVALICHGNGGPLENFLFVQMWFGELGITSYSFDYRGFGRSEGWPNEKGIYLDSEAVWDYVANKEQVSPAQIIVVGISVGSAPAARLAAKYHPKVLFLSSAFTDLRSAIRSQPIVGLLHRFVWSKFPTIEFVKQLRQTDLLIAHGATDRIVPGGHSIEIETAYKGVGRVLRLKSQIAGHNMAFYDLKDDLKKAIATLLST